MKALDTNLLARLLLGDDAAQLNRVKSLLALDESYTAPVTVMLELVWVLESYDCTREEIFRGLNLLLGLENFRPMQDVEIRRSLVLYESGMDFADALHLSLSRDAEQLLTFDKAFIKIARKKGLSEFVAPA